jgi:hypothetical protein
MKPCLLLLLFFIFFNSRSLYAKNKFSGDFNLSSYIFADRLNSNNFSEQSITEGRFSFKFKSKINKNFGLILSPDIDFSENKNSKSSNLYLRSENSGLYFNYRKKYLLTAGLLTHSFGLSQLFSPLNIVDTNSYWSPLNSGKIGSPTLRAMYKTRHFRAFASWLPRRLENIYPGNSSPWLPTKAPGRLISEGDTFLFPNRVRYIIQDKEDIGGALSNNFVGGLRFDYKPFLTQFIYYKGVDPDPTFDPDLELTSLEVTPGSRVFQVENPVRVIPIYQKVERMGLSFRYTLPIKWRLLYEGNLSRGLANERQGYRESQTHTLGLEWGVPLGKTLLLGVLQFYRSRNSNPSSLGLVSPFRQAYLIGANWDYKNISLSGGFFKSQSLEINLKLTIKGTFISGELEELLSGVLDLDTVGLETSYLF